MITGNNLDPVIDDTTLLADLNGGKGVQFSTSGGPDLSIALSNGTVFSVTFHNPQTIGDVITQIDDAPGNDGQLAAAINADGNGLVLTDLTLGTSLFNVIGQQGSGAALGLGLVGIGFSNPTLDPTTPLSHLNNGAGVSFSTTGGADLKVTLSSGTVLTITFSQADDDRRPNQPGRRRAGKQRPVDAGLQRHRHRLGPVRHSIGGRQVDGAEPSPARMRRPASA